MSSSHRLRSAALAAAASSLLMLTISAVGPSSRAQASSGCQVKQGPVGAAFPDCSQGQLFNIVPPGQTGTYDLADYMRAQAGQGFPPYTRDQEPLYANLVNVAPHLTPGGITTFYKDASFVTDMTAPGTRVETFPSPHQGTVIIRDGAHGVPHIFGVTRADTEFGSGFASAEDRLFEMDVLRHVGRAQLTSFIGPSASNEAMDCSVASAAGYSEAELQNQVDNFASRHTEPIRIAGKKTTVGQQIVSDANAYVDGVNQYINDAETQQGGAKLPAEYGLLQIPLNSWKATDIVATATLVQAIFATGGGNEVASALFYESLVQRYGAVQGAAIWGDLRSQNDPGAQVSIPTTFNYEHVPAAGNLDPNSLAMPLAPPTNTFTVASDGTTHCTVTPLASSSAPAGAERCHRRPEPSPDRRAAPQQPGGQQ